ncbi:MAG: hypothetical protein KC466_20505 [Myxococcales bacterium]|nr:hypothetical protein [Myxococcales bacterium]
MNGRVKVWIIALVGAKLLLGLGSGFLESAKAQATGSDADPATPQTWEDVEGVDEEAPRVIARKLVVEERDDGLDPVDLELRERELRARNQEMDERERRIRQRETDLQALRSEIDSKLKTLEDTREEVRQAEIRLQEQIENAQQTAEAQRSKALAKIYGAMKPRDAAPLVSKLDPEIVRGMFVQMKDKQVAGIMAQLRPEVAVKITEGLSKVRPLKPKGSPDGAQGG